MWRYVAVLVVLPVALVGFSVWTDSELGKLAETDEYTIVEQFAQKTVGFAVAVIDGKTYDYRAARDLMGRKEAEALQLKDDAKAGLVDAANAMFDAEEANVDAYLDWHYSLNHEYATLLYSYKAEDYAAEKLAEYLEDGVDTDQVNELVSEASDAYEELRNEAAAELEKYEISSSDVPEWLCVTKEIATLDDYLKPLEFPEDDFEAVKSRLTVAGAGGIATSIATAAIVKRLVKKKVIKTMGAKLATCVMPLGTGIVASVAIDWAMVKADRAKNGEAFKQQIIDAIEEQRTETLEMIEAM